MNLIPTVGAENIYFGTTESVLINLLGKPVSIQQLSNTDGYPRDRRILDYGKYFFLINDDCGVISITVEAIATPLLLWDKDISLFSPIDLQGYLGTMGYSANIEHEPPWDDCDVIAIECGVIAYFCEDKLESIEVLEDLAKLRLNYSI
ncbi:hypothetical protein [Chamaesiphon polymorphus]|uniref:Uncharacterized protein n=1 Tax=Chamaesiphon polymorphus CCALA 037 TaxID=2107692 RepID=A0A2T1GK48_9CYAN|nr:hypothetical protein [Chamaesiphon polymorphus]PSB58097.1 hypothetical protein C7B77_06025 [Chamaesiphon polymorphus CCALA 037]